MEMPGNATPREPVAEITEIPDGARIAVELPGVSQDGIKMEVSGRMVRIDAEGSRGKFSTIQAVGFDPDPDRMSVTFTQGVLEILLLSKGAPTAEVPKAPPEAPRESPELKALQSELERVVGELGRMSEERAALQMRVAALQKDFQNLRRRHEEEKHILAERRVEDIAISLIEVLDNFERARSGMEGHRSKRPSLDPFLKGIGMVEDSIKVVFCQLGIVPIQSVGRAFDPAYHMSVETVSEKGRPDMEIVSEKLRGYVYNGKVLRPANVVVNRSACRDGGTDARDKVR
jgi:molecular chaperone GrpE